MKLIQPRTFYLLGGLVAVFLLFHGVENLRGGRAWQQWQKEREAAGDSFDPTSFLPPPVPDAENFAAAPRIAAAIRGTQSLVTVDGWPENRVGNWREGQRADLEAFQAQFKHGDLATWLGTQKDTLDEIALAAKRPGCRLPATYLPLKAGTFPNISEFPNLLGFRAAARVLQLRALVALRAGRNEDAFQDVATLLRLSRQYRKEPLLLCQLLRMALGGIALQPLWEGLESQAWTRPQLLAFQDLLAQDVLGSLALAWKLERTWRGPLHAEMAGEAPWSWKNYPVSFSINGEGPSRTGLAILRRLAIPRGWVLQNALRGDRAILEIVLEPLDPVQHRVDPRRQDSALAGRIRPGRSPYTFLVPDVGESFAQQNIRAARAQVGLDQAWIACELELHRQAQGAYPRDLADLKTTLPLDVITGLPLRYRAREDGGYVLYSLGWNGVDDGGEPGHGKDPLREGDWVWLIQRPGR